MQRFNTFIVILLISFLTGCVQTPTTKSPVESRPVEPIQRAPEPIQIVPSQSRTEAIPLPQQPSPTAVPIDTQPKPPLSTAPLLPSTVTDMPAPLAGAKTIGLILPLKSSVFAQAAEAVRQGFLTASKKLGANAPNIKIYGVDDKVENILPAYEQALQDKVQVIVGPLTKNGASALASNSNLIKVPTLVLNTPDTNSTSPLFYHFALAVEAEAKQVARLAWSEVVTKDSAQKEADRESGLKEGPRIAILTANTSLAKRMQQAFQEEWVKLGGVVAVHFPASTEESELQIFNRAVVRSKAEKIFLAMDNILLKKIRPYLDPLVPTYTTSHTFDGSKGQDPSFNNVRFVDMPWLAQSDHPAVMIYPRSEYVLSGELERLYAFGIDAFRLSQEIDKRITPNNFVLDGVTGRITLGTDRQFVRESVPVIFLNGWIAPLERFMR